MIGSHVAADLAARGDDVTVMARRDPSDRDPRAVRGMPRLQGDYTDPGTSPRMLEGFDAIVFAAGNDIRHVPAEQEDDAFWARTQSVGVPQFAAQAKAAGVGRFVQVGSYYHHLHPEWTARIPYVAARRDADERTRALSGAGFAAMTLNPPSIVGADERGMRRFARMIAWTRGELADPELFAPPGGTNYMSVRSLSQAVQGALDGGEAGRAYLIGDRNLTYREYFQLARGRRRQRERDRGARPGASVPPRSVHRPGAWCGDLLRHRPRGDGAARLRPGRRRTVTRRDRHRGGRSAVRRSHSDAVALRVSSRVPSVRRTTSAIAIRSTSSP